MRAAVIGTVLVATVGAAALAGFSLGRRSSPSGSDAIPSPSGQLRVTGTPARAPRPALTVTNTCYVSPPIQGHDGANSVMLEVLLDGVYGGRHAQVIVSGSCNYWWGNEPNFGVGERARSWDCDIKTFGTDWPPRLVEEDIRGNPQLENWYGPRPQPDVGDRKSLHPLRIDDFALSGPGQLSIDCDARTEEFDSSPLTSKCKMSWYNKFVPAEAHFEGTCGVKAAVRDQ